MPGTCFFFLGVWDARETGVLLSRSRLMVRARLIQDDDGWYTCKHLGYRVSETRPSAPWLTHTHRDEGLDPYVLVGCRVRSCWIEPRCRIDGANVCSPLSVRFRARCDAMPQVRFREPWRRQGLGIRRGRCDRSSARRGAHQLSQRVSPSRHRPTSGYERASVRRVRSTLACASIRSPFRTSRWLQLTRPSMDQTECGSSRFRFFFFFGVG